MRSHPNNNKVSKAPKASVAKAQTTKGKAKQSNQTPREGIADAHVNRKKKESSFAKSCEEWCETITRAVGKKYFNAIQFIVHSKDEDMGSHWQKLLCGEAKVPIRHQEAFWERSYKGGKTTARLCLNRRRMNVTNSMKKKFLGALCFELIV
jgi:uncharacterized glyoxalase superfamily protein PhnB